MDQSRFEGLLRTFQSRCSTQHAVRDLAAMPGQATAPIVVLVHGIGGNARHWSNPTAINPNETWLVNLEAEPQPATSGILTSPPYTAEAVTTWTQFLQRNHITSINFSQSQSVGALQPAAQELTSVLRVLEETVFRPYAEEAKTGDKLPPLIILCHSRGGLVTRAALKQLGQAGVPHLRKVITLSTPHHGSYMPRLANDYNRTLQTAVDFSAVAERLPFFIRGFFEQTIDRYVDTLANGVREAVLHSFGTLAHGPGFEELIPGSATLAALGQKEQPIPGVSYFSFGGSNPVFVKFYLSGLGQAVYLMSAIGSFLIERLSIIPGVATTYGGLAELVQGDSAVALPSSSWPTAFRARHQALSFNHMQALVDPALQNAVLQVIRA